MKFQFNPQKVNYEDFAAGRVLLAQAGTTSFPVRLASEIFQLCAARLEKEQLHIYDPCCGSGFLLTVLGFLHHETIAALYGSDISQKTVEIARKNLNLLDKAGLLARREVIAELYRQYGKESHQGALASCDALLERLPEQALNTGIWLADAGLSSLAPETIDLLICDVPYGEKVSWESDAAEPVYQLLEAQYPVLRAGSLAVIISDKGQKAEHPQYQRYKQIKHGKRLIRVLEKV